MFNLPAGITRNVVIAFAAGVVAGALAYKYVRVEKKLDLGQLKDNLTKLARSAPESGESRT